MGSVAITVDDDTRTAGLIRARLHEYNLAAAPWPASRQMVVAARDPAGRLAGGLVGHTDWQWLHIDVLWVAEDSRRRGIGRQLVDAAERAAIARGCTGAHLDTFSFQAPGFYARLGYREFGRLERYGGEHTRFYLFKDLV